MIQVAHESCAILGTVEKIALKTIEVLDRQEHVRLLRMVGHFGERLQSPFPLVGGGAAAAEMAERRVNRPAQKMCACSRGRVDDPL